jgi:acyl-CoA thioesterase
VAPPPSPWPFAELLGIRPKSVGDGRARFELDVEAKHLNPHGTLHGGVVYSLADSAMGAALFSLLEPGELCATLEIKMHYLVSVTGGALAAEAAVVDRTKRIGVLEARVFGDGDRLVALATGTFYIQSART